MKSSVCKLLFSVVLVLSVSINVVAIEGVKDDPTMTVEEFAELIGYRSVRKLSLGTLGELLDIGDQGHLEVALKVDIYRNEDAVYFEDYYAFKATDVVPLQPDQTIIISSWWVHHYPSLGNDNEVHLRYALAEDKDAPGYMLYYGVGEQVPNCSLIVIPELFDPKYVWGSSVISADRVSEEQKAVGIAPYFWAGANYRERDEGEGRVILGGFELNDIPKIAVSFNIFVVFSYELEFKKN